MRDKQLELKVDVGLISLIKNGLHKKAKALYDVSWLSGDERDATKNAEWDEVFEVVIVSWK